MSLINKEVGDFKVQAYVDDSFKEVCKADILGKWNIFFFYTADFSFICPTELEDLEETYPTLKSLGVNATIRRTLGSDINASCGQLRRKKNEGDSQ